MHLNLIVAAMLLLSACSFSSSSSGQGPVDSCADKFVKGAVNSTTVVPGAYNCADSREQGILQSNNHRSDQDMADTVNLNGALSVTACGPYFPHDGSRYEKDYEILSPVDQSYGVLMIYFNKSDGKVNQVDFKSMTHCAVKST